VLFRIFTAVTKMNKLGCQGCGLVELVKVSICHPKGPQFQSWCGLMENNSDQNYNLLKHLSVFIQEPYFPMLFLGRVQTGSRASLD
jgi:hypothetical protein